MPPRQSIWQRDHAACQANTNTEVQTGEKKNGYLIELLREALPFIVQTPETEALRDEIEVAIGRAG